MDQPEPPLSVVRQKVSAAFRELAAGDGECAETILIKDRHFVGRRFCLGGFEVVWLAGEVRISIFDEAGQMIDAQSLEEAEMPLRKAA